MNSEVDDDNHVELHQALRAILSMLGWKHWDERLLAKVALATPSVLVPF